MNQDLALNILGEIMKWPDDRARQEFAWLKLMARIKYDGYRDFQAGIRFIESLVMWLQQFQPGSERKTAYHLVRHTLVYIGRGEMQHLAEQFYPRFVRSHLVNLVADECGVPPYRVLADKNSIAAERRLRRCTLFMGLSDGAHVDTIRHANAGLLSNEQFVQVTQVDTEKWRDLIDKLRHDLKDADALFRLVYFIDDFTATGTSFLRLDEKRQWKGKLIRFKDSMEGARTTNGKFVEDNWQLRIHHHVASLNAHDTIRCRLREANAALPASWNRPLHTSFGMVFPADLPIDSTSAQHEEFIELTKRYYDPELETEHTQIGGVTHLGLGYGGCAIPVVLEHNTPNNSVALLWAETRGGERDGVVAPAMRPLFRRRQRHI